MDNNIKILLQKFDKINKKGWIEGANKNPSSVGLTFERELDEKIDTLSEPDFEDIEIKLIFLFSKVFEYYADQELLVLNTKEVTFNC